MKRNLLTFILLLSIQFALGQTIRDLERDLSIHGGQIKYGDKIEKAKNLQKLDPFNIQAARYICDYYKIKKIDSVSIFFDNLAAQFPNSPKPYNLRYELLFLENDYTQRDNYNNQKVKILNKALAVDSLDQETLYNLSKTYYEDFVYPFEKRRYSMFEIIEDTIIIKKSTFGYSADSALIYFYKIWRTNKDLREIIYYPIRQLECHLSKLDGSHIPKNAESEFEQCFYPSSYFANLKEQWQCNKTTDYLFAIEMSKRNAEGLKQQLSDLDENCIYNLEISPNKTIYRFTWLRSFHTPISVRIEKIDNNIELYWKEGKGAGGYEPRGLKKSGRKKLKESEWTEFTNLVGTSGFDSLPNDNYVPMTDGATWTLERKTSKGFKAHDTNDPSKEFSNACLYLIKKTRIKVKDEDIY
jgi:hypothetical protein